MQDKHYLVYLITNTVNGKIYVGKHETFDPDDDYMGSGTMLKRAQNKYGLDKFTKTILADFDEPWSMANMEATIVDEEFVKRKDTYNITLGGTGGFWYATQCQHKETRNKFAKGNTCYRDYLNSLSEQERALVKKQWRIAQKRGCEQYRKTHPGPGHFAGKHHTEEQLRKMKETFSKIGHSQGEKNPHYGQHWWHDPQTGESHPFHDKDVPFGWIKGRHIKR